MIRDTLLIIDDSELDLAILEEIFKNQFHVKCVSDSRQGLSFLHNNGERVCAILLDICLERPGAGFTVLHQLQSNPSTSVFPVVLITGDANENDVRASVERGAVDFLAKPVNPHTVRERVQNIVHTAWPAGSTILDCPPEPAYNQSVQSDPQEITSPAENKVLKKSQEFFDIWYKKLESFCRLRDGMNINSHQQLGKITALLAHRYVLMFPDKCLSQEDAVLIGQASVFCDIGLLGMPDNVIAGDKNPEAGNGHFYYQHTILGAELLSPEKSLSPLLCYASEIALWHHKNIDGSGYPLDADPGTIPLSAQLTRTALRIQHYLYFYRGYPDCVERTLHSLKHETGLIFAPEFLQIAEYEKDALKKIVSDYSGDFN